MGHARADVFRRYYIHQTVKVDTQSVYLGTTNRTDLTKTIGLMNKKRDPRVPIKLGPAGGRLENHPELSAIKDEQKRLTTILKEACGTVGEAKICQPEKYLEHTRLSREIRSIREHLKRSALKDSGAKFFENADHDEIRQQLRGGDVSTSTYPKPKFSRPTRPQIPEAFSSVEAMTPNKWSETVRALSVSARKHPAFTPRRPRARKTCTYSAIAMIRYRLQSDFTRSPRLEPSGPTSRDIYLSWHLENRSTYPCFLPKLTFFVGDRWWDGTAAFPHGRYSA